MTAFDFRHTRSSRPLQSEFPLHNHSGDELYLYINGNCEYIVEGVTYPLSPFDLIIISRSEMHRVRHKAMSPYERMVLSVKPEFYAKAGCPEYEKVFTEKKIGKNSKIGYRQLEQSGLKDAFLRFDKYHKEAPRAAALLQGILIEILHILSSIDILDDDSDENPLIAGITEYLTENLSSPLSLDDIADKFYISKYHLCRIFKATTGLTVNGYITHKRLMRVKELHADGMKLNPASIEAGFPEYSAFYRAYVKEFGCNPRSSL